jgi:hypothetical protein
MPLRALKKMDKPLPVQSFNRHQLDSFHCFKFHILDDEALELRERAAGRLREQPGFDFLCFHRMFSAVKKTINPGSCCTAALPAQQRQGTRHVEVSRQALDGYAGSLRFLFMSSSWTHAIY